MVIPMADMILTTIIKILIEKNNNEITKRETLSYFIIAPLVSSTVSICSPRNSAAMLPFVHWAISSINASLCSAAVRTFIVTFSRYSIFSII